MVDPRVIRSRAAIIAAATTLFLRDGYAATTMDDIAEAAGVSKRTVYNNFADKDALFREVVMAAVGIAETFAADAAAELADPDDLPAALYALARRLAARATDPRVVQLRRLLIGEAHRFPDLAAEYYRLAPGRVMATLATALEQLDRRGRLQVPDAQRAAEQLAFLVLGPALDRAMFDGRRDTAALTRAADDGVRTFLAVYGTR
jgi:TetR/AcrR family transcriptional regulator, mexJK operon transcriptional repressor